MVDRDEEDGFPRFDTRLRRHHLHVIPIKSMLLLLPTQIQMVVRGLSLALALEVFAGAAGVAAGGGVAAVLGGDPVMSLGPAGNRSRRAPCTARGIRIAGGLA